MISGGFLFWGISGLECYAFVCLSVKDLAMYINEVKRDNETLKKISEFQSSIENLVSVHEVVRYTSTIW